MVDSVDRNKAIDAAIEAADDWDGGHNVNVRRAQMIKDALEVLPFAQSEITEEDVREWCYKRGLTIIDNALYLEMRSRWSASEDAQPVRRGEWIEDVAYYDEDGCPCVITRCNQCGEPNPVSKFCPHCGAFMKGVRAENVH